MLGVEDGKNRNRTGRPTYTLTDKDQSEVQTKNHGSPSAKSEKHKKSMD